MTGRSLNPNWDPARYLSFAEERLRPALDLIARIPELTAPRITDLGCGPGGVTQLLKRRWPHARITALDNSESMLAEARLKDPGITWEQQDIATWRPSEKQGLIFSNAALHWLGGHEAFLPKLISFLEPGGTLAIQMPDTHHGAWRQILRDLAGQRPWRSFFKDFTNPATTLSLQDYYSTLAPHCSGLQIWASEYLHLLRGEDAVAHWTEGAGARPYLEALDEEERGSFIKAYRRALRESYPASQSGLTPFQFRRLFLVATKGTYPVIR